MAVNQDEPKQKPRSYEQMVKDGDWPPTTRETVLFVMGFILGMVVAWGLSNL